MKANNKINQSQSDSKAIQSLLSLDVSTRQDHESFDDNPTQEESYCLINKLRILFGLDQKQKIQLRDNLEELLESNGFYYFYMQRVQNNMVIVLETCPSDAQIQSENGSRSVIYKGIPLNVVVFFFGFFFDGE